MCRALIFTKQMPAHPDPEIDAMTYKPGMVITVIEDGRQFGTGSVGDHARVVEFPGIPAADLLELCRPLTKTETVVFGKETRIVTKAVRMRALQAKSVLLLNGQQNMTRAEVGTFITAQFDRLPAPINPLVIE